MIAYLSRSCRAQSRYRAALTGLSTSAQRAEVYPEHVDGLEANEF